MNHKGLIRCVAAAAMSLFICASAGVAASADSTGYTFGTAEVTALTASSGGTFDIPVSKLTLAHDGQYRIVPDASDSSLTFTYHSSKSSVAKVSNKGLIVAVSPGKATVTCTASDGTSKKVSVTVAKEGEDNFPTAVYYTESQCNILTGETYHPTAKVTPKGCTYTVSYYSDDTSVATADSSGNITAVSPGICNVTITTSNGCSSTIAVIVSDEPVPAAYVEYEDDSISLNVGDKVRPAVSAFPDDNMKFTSADTSVAKVSVKGTILGVSEGVTEITASNGISYDTITVSVGDVSQTDDDTYIYDENGNLLPTRVEYEHGSDSVEIGSKLSPSIKVYPKGAVTSFKFHSSDTSVAKVSSKGTVLGVGEGTCEIYVKTDNGCMASFTVTVFRERFSGIDVSKWNGDIDWETVSQNPDVDFVMIRASYGTETEDIRLVQNVAGCEAYNIPYGFYHYMYAKSVEEALIEADFFLKTVRPYNPTYPLVLDIEESYYKTMTKEEVTDIVCAFMEKVENAGYYAMIYSYASFFGDSLIYDRVKIYDNWVACWGDQERLSSNFSYSYGMWQYSETGRMDGIPEDVDLNYSYKNYPYIINKYGLTGYNNLGDAPEDDDDISWYTEVYEVTE